MPELSAHAWDAFQKYLTVQQVRKGDFISKAGEVVKHVSFLNSGMARMYYRADDKEYITAFFLPGDYAADYESFLTQKPAHLFFEAMEDTEVINLSYDDMQRCYVEFPEFQKFGRLMAEFLYLMVSDRTASLILKSPEQRYLDFIERSPKWMNLVPQYMIASYLGVTPEALSRIRKRISQ